MAGRMFPAHQNLLHLFITRSHFIQEIVALNVQTTNYPAKKRYWGSVAENYDHVTTGSPLRQFLGGREFSLLARIASEHMESNSTVLDAPTGTGRFLPLLQSLGHNVTGIDISPDMLRLQNSRHTRSGTLLVRGDCETLPFKDNSFDYVVSFRFMGHVPPPVRIGVLQEFKRIARKGLVVGYPVLNPLTRIKFALGNIRYRLEHGQPRTWWPATSVSMHRELDMAGLKITRQVRLLGAFSQIVFLYLTPRESGGVKNNTAQDDTHFVFV